MKERHALAWIETDTAGDHYVVCHVGDDSTIVGKACNLAKIALPGVRWDTLYFMKESDLKTARRPQHGDDYRNRVGQAAIELAVRAYPFYPG